VSVWHTFATALTGAFVLLFLYLGHWFVRGLNRLRPTHLLAESELPTATVLVAARNEAQNAIELAQSLTALQYPREKLRILIVDDRSSDGTAALAVSHGEGRIETLRIEVCPVGVAPKKNAILAGIAHSSSEIIAVVDADNRPDPMWLWNHASHLVGDTGVSAGLVFHAREDDVSEAFHGLWASEIFIFGVLSAGSIGNHFPLSANGGNLAYRRRTFDEAGAYAKNLGVISGDDDFLVQAVAARTPWRVDFAVDAATQVPTRGPKSWSQAWEQRKRWASKCVRYERPQVALLSVVFAGYAWLLLQLPIGIFDHRAWLWMLPLWGALWLSGIRIYAHGIRVFGPRVRCRWFPLAMIMQVPLAVAASVLGTFGRFQWKDGSVEGGALR